MLDQPLTLVNRWSALDCPPVAGSALEEAQDIPPPCVMHETARGNEEDGGHL